MPKTEVTENSLFLLFVEGGLVVSAPAPPKKKKKKLVTLILKSHLIIQVISKDVV